MAYERIFGDITEVSADALVTPASRYPRIGKGLDMAVHAAAGEPLLESRREFGIMQPGEVNHSPAFGLSEKTKAKFVIHAVGPNRLICGENDIVMLEFLLILIIVSWCIQDDLRTDG